MKQNVNVTLRSVQTNDDETNETELRTAGTYEKKNGAWHITYEESEATGFEGSITDITIKNNKWVSIVRTGSANSNLMIETGKKHYSLYGTPFGDIMVGVFTHKIESTLTENGGKLYLKYTLDANASYLSDNEIYLEISKA